MAKKIQSNKGKTKKHLAREQREAKQTRILIIIAVVVGVIILGLVGYGVVDQMIVRPRKEVAQVGDEVIRVREFESRVKYTRLQMLNQTYQYYNFYQQFGEFGQSFLQTAQTIASQLAQPQLLGRDVLNQMIDEIIIREEAAKRNISVSDDEINQAMYAAFGFFPDGTSTPTITATIEATPTYSETQLALVTLTPTPTATDLPTETPQVTPTLTEDSEALDDTPENNVPATDVADDDKTDNDGEDNAETPEAELSPTITSTPTITLTPTPYTTQILAGNIKDFEKLYKPYNFDYDDLREIIEVDILRRKLIADVLQDLEPVQEEVWARHILVESEEKARKVLGLLEDGDDFAQLAALYSTDDSNKDNGGDLGWFNDRTMVPEFSEAAFSLEEGEISEPIETSFGFHIIQVLGKRKSQIMPNDFEQLKQEEFANWLNEIRERRTDITIDDQVESYIPTSPEVPQQFLIELYQQMP